MVLLNTSSRNYRTKWTQSWIDDWQEGGGTSFQNHKLTKCHSIKLKKADPWNQQDPEPKPTKLGPPANSWSHHKPILGANLIIKLKLILKITFLLLRGLALLTTVLAPFLQLGPCAWPANAQDIPHRPSWCGQGRSYCPKLSWARCRPSCAASCP